MTQFIEFPFPLREELLVYLKLPTDLTNKEVNRLVEHLESLASYDSNSEQQDIDLNSIQNSLK